MRVLFLQQQPCVAGADEVRGRPRGAVELGFAYRGRTLSELTAPRELYESGIRRGRTRRRRCRRSSRRSHPDVIHSRNLPDELTVLALDSVDVPGTPRRARHETPAPDALRGRHPEPDDPPELERRAAEESAALVTHPPKLVAELAARSARRTTWWPTRTTRWGAIYRRREGPTPSERPAATRYQGTLSTNGGHYDLRDLFAAIAEQGVSLEHGARGARVPRDPGHPRPRPGCRGRPAARARCTTTSAGAGFNACFNGAHLDTTALPNKLYAVPRLRAAGDHAAAHRAAADAGARRALASRSTTSWPRRWRLPTWPGRRRRVASGASSTPSSPRSAASRRSTTRSPAHRWATA